MMMMGNCKDEVIYARIPKVDTTKGLFEEIDVNEKHH